MRTYFYLLITIVITFSSFSYAQSNELLFAPSTKVTKGGTYFKADAIGSVDYVDNYLYQIDNEQSALISSLSAKAKMQVENKKTLWNVNGFAGYNKINNFSEDDHTDYSLSGSYHYKFTPKLEVLAHGSTDRRYVYRGQEITVGQDQQFTSGNSISNQAALITTNYGSDGSIAKLNATLGFLKSSYDKFRAQTKLFDVKKSYLELGGDYLISGKSYLSVESTYIKNTFDNDDGRDNDTLGVLGGVKWSPSEISKLAILAGYQRLSFKNDNIANQNKFTWRANYKWQPMEQLYLNFVSGRNFDDSLNEAEDYRIVDSHDLTINYIYHRRLILALNAGFNKDTAFSQTTERVLEYTKLGAAVKYQWRQRIHFYLNTGLNQLDSTEATQGYDRLNASIGLTVRI
mgnify:CR=1 FL=1